MTPEEFKKKLITDLPPIQGYIQSYNSEKGFGFIKAETNETYFFHVTCFEHAIEPRRGMRVNLKPSPQAPLPGKNPQASKVWLNKERARETKVFNDDSKVTCPHCGKRVLPRMSFLQGSPDRSFCPLCGGLIKQFSEPVKDSSLEIIFAFVFFLIFIGLFLFAVG